MGSKIFSRNIWTGGFNYVLKKIRVISADEGCVAELKVDQEHVNSAGILHSGLSVTLVDVLSSVALNTHEKGITPTVSVDMNLKFMESAKTGEEILVDARIIHRGNALAFSEVLIKNKSTNDLLVSGTHTMYFLQPGK